jgi:predicted nucleic acid-binding protein
MPRRVIIDAGALVAFLHRDDEWHDWAAEQFKRFRRLETCEAAVAEACARMEYFGLDQTRVGRLVQDGVVTITFAAQGNIGRIVQLMDKYADRPMDFADACLVVMSEVQKDVLVITTDSDFVFYRRHGRDVIPLELAGEQ